MKRKRVLVIGLGRFGTSLVQSLWEAGAEIIAVDEHSEAVDAVKDQTSAAFIGDATQLSVLEGIGAADAEVGVVTFGEDFEASVLCVASLKRLKVPEIIARAATERQAEVLQAVGATRVIQLEKHMGDRVAIEMMTPADAEFVDFASRYRVVPFTVQGELAGKTLIEANLRQRFSIHVLGYRRCETKSQGGKPKLEVPKPDYMMREGDTLLVVGEEENVNEFIAQMRETS